MAVEQSEYFEALQEACFDELADIAEQLHGLECSVRWSLLPVVRELAEHEDEWRADGAASVDSWLAMRLGVSVGEARDLVLVAECVTDLPHLSERFASGQLSWNRLVLLCRFVTPETDALYANEGPSMSIAQLRELARRAEVVTANDAVAAHDARSLSFRPSRCGRLLRLAGDLPIDMGAVVQAAVERVGDAQGPEPDGTHLPAHQRNADALVEICSTAVAQDSDSARANVVVEADVAILNGVGNADINGMGPVGPETVKRFLCDARLQVAIVEDGKTIGFGRSVRTFPVPLMKRLRRRDQSCRWVGCQRRRWLQGHHVEHWVEGGATDEDNGLILCSHHHRFVHEHGWKIKGSVYGALTFIRPDGRRHTGMPPPLRDEVRKKLPWPEVG